MSVYQVQCKLNQLGYFHGKKDGIYGPITAQAVRQFQAQVGINVDGIIGPITLGKLFGVQNGQKKSQKKTTKLKRTYFCSSCNYTEGIGYGSLIGLGQSIAIHPNEPCYKYGRKIKVDGVWMTIHDKCGTQKVVDIWRGQRPLQKSNNHNCQECKTILDSGKWAVIQWEE